MRPISETPGSRRTYNVPGCGRHRSRSPRAVVTEGHKRDLAGADRIVADVPGPGAAQHVTLTPDESSPVAPSYADGRGASQGTIGETDAGDRDERGADGVRCGPTCALDARRLLQHVVAAGTLHTPTMTAEVREKRGLATVPREAPPGLHPVMKELVPTRS